jgi:protein SCO1
MFIDKAGRHLMRKNSKYFLLTALFVVSVAFPGRQCFADLKLTEKSVGITERLDNSIPADLIFTNQDGQQVNLKQLVNKPTVINFVYFRCPGICSPLMNGLEDVIDLSDLQLGKDYQVITISFDSEETSDLAVKKRANYLKMIKTQKDVSGWMFLTGDSLNIARATESMGFGFKKSGNEYIHEASLILLSPEGKITRYLKGITFLPFEFKLAIIEASQGKSVHTVNKVLQFCYSFDPKSQHYMLDITKIAGVFVLILLLTLLLTLLIKSRLRKKAGIQS